MSCTMQLGFYWHAFSQMTKNWLFRSIKHKQMSIYVMKVIDVSNIIGIML